MKNGIFLMGTQGAGKSFWAKSNTPPGYLYLNSDAEFLKVYPLSEYEEKFAEGTKIADQKFHEAVKAGQDFLYDRTGASFERMKAFFNEAKAQGYSLKLVFIDTAVSIALRQNAGRDRKVPDALVIDTYHKVKKIFEQARTLPWNFIEHVRREETPWTAIENKR